MRVQKVGGAEGWGCASKAGVRAGEVTAEATFEGRCLRVRRPVLPVLSGHGREGRGCGQRGQGKVLRGLVGHREDFTLTNETRALLGF